MGGYILYVTKDRLDTNYSNEKNHKNPLTDLEMYDILSVATVLFRIVQLVLL